MLEKLKATFQEEALKSFTKAAQDGIQLDDIGTVINDLKKKWAECSGSFPESQRAAEFERVILAGLKEVGFPEAAIEASLVSLGISQSKASGWKQLLGCLLSCAAIAVSAAKGVAVEEPKALEPQPQKPQAPQPPQPAPTESATQESKAVESRPAAPVKAEDTPLEKPTQTEQTPVAPEPAPVEPLPESPKEETSKSDDSTATESAPPTPKETQSDLQSHTEQADQPVPSETLKE